jgi:hypothetical protein
MTPKNEFALADPEVVEAWQCIGCGRVEAPQPCIGVRQDRKVRLVDASSYEEALAWLRQAKWEAAALEGFVRRLALTRPRQGQWERSYKSFRAGEACTIRAFSSPVGRRRAACRAA